MPNDSENARPRIGKVYDDDYPRPPAPEPSDLRKRLVAVVDEGLASVWDAREELALRAIKDVLDLHSPWQRWEQVFHPRYVGERYLGPGCRMCGPSPPQSSAE